MLGLTPRQAVGCAVRSILLLIIVVVLCTVFFVLGYRITDAIYAALH